MVTQRAVYGMCLEIAPDSIMGRYFQAFIFVLCGSGVYVLLATLMASGDKPGSGKMGTELKNNQTQPEAEIKLLQPGKLR
jgi:hypothetical protein